MASHTWKAPHSSECIPVLKWCMTVLERPQRSVRGSRFLTSLRGHVSIRVLLPSDESGLTKCLHQMWVQILLSPTCGSPESRRTMAGNEETSKCFPHPLHSPCVALWAMLAYLELGISTVGCSLLQPFWVLKRPWNLLALTSALSLLGLINIVHRINKNPPNSSDKL